MDSKNWALFLSGMLVGIILLITLTGWFPALHPTRATPEHELKWLSYNTDTELYCVDKTVTVHECKVCGKMFAVKSEHWTQLDDEMVYWEDEDDTENP